MIAAIFKTVCLGLLATGTAHASEDMPGIDFGGLIDLRAVHTGDVASWLDHGLGKSRFGAGSDGARWLGRVGEAALLVRADINWSTTAHLYAKYDPDQHRPLDLVEAYVVYRPVSTSAYRFSGRAGAFFPPVSLENSGPAWTSPYTISSSAINTWVGEELRILGGEGTLQWQGEDQRLSLSGALYRANDPAGSLIAWRGWALHDFKSGLGERVPLPPTSSFGPTGDFPRQAPWVEPFHEIDGRWGDYAALAWERPGEFTLRALYYDNHADPSAFNGTQWAWHTKFSSFGARLPLPRDAELLAQYMRGNTFMRARRNVVDTDFSACYLLLSKRIQRHRLSLRYDLFDVQDNIDGEYNDHGHAWTLAYALELREKQRLMLELLDISSNHPQRDDLGLPAAAREHILQASYRIFF